jgi:sulfate adenylyltransferase subunit 2
MQGPADGGGKHLKRNVVYIFQKIKCSSILKLIMSSYHLDYLQQLETESIHIFREVAAQFERPALLFSGGKDSITLVHLARKAFAPGKIPFPLVHIDTGHNFPEALAFRDWLAEEVGATLIVRKVEDTIRERKLTEPKGKFPSRNWLQTHTLLDTIEEFKFDCCIGGARRDEEKARAKERIFSVRDEFGQWDPKLQRPELWNIFNGRIHKGENVRVFPISNWTELDIWNYIRQEKIDLPSIYFAHDREVIIHEGQLVAMSEYVQSADTDIILTKRVRYRTVGDMTCTAAVESEAATLDEVINEIIATKISERGETRIDDKVTEAAMEDRKKNGYF